MKKITGMEQTLRIVLGVQFGVLAAIVMVSFMGVHRLIGEAAWVAHTHEVNTAVCQSLIDHSTIKVNARSYLLIGDERLLEEMRNAWGRLSLDVHKIDVLTRDNTSQRQNIAAYRRVLADHMRLTEEIVRLRAGGMREAALKPFRDGRIEAATRSVVDAVEVVLGEENRLLVRRKDNLSAVVNSIYGSAPFAAFAELASVIVVYVLINKICHKNGV